MYATVEYEVENLDVKMEMVKRKNRWHIFTPSSPEPRGYTSPQVLVIKTI
jgi:hypothetical protein